MSLPISWHEETIEGKTAGTGAGTFPEMRGWIESIHYEPHATSALNAASVLKVEVALPTQPTPSLQTTKIIVLTGIVLSAALTFYPRTPAHDSVGAAIAGTALLVPLAGQRLEFSFTGAADAEFGHFLVHYRKA